VRVYVAAPIAGIDPAKRDAAFAAGAQAVVAADNDPVLPMEVPPWPHEGPCPEGALSAEGFHNVPCHVRGEMSALIQCDALLLMPGWQDSKGCMLEASVAYEIGLSVTEWADSARERQGSEGSFESE